MNSLSTNPEFWLVYFIVAFAMGYWNYRKGHSLMIGFFISALFTPVVGLLFNIFAKPNNEVLRRRAAASVKPIRCSSCGEKIPAKSYKCPKCGVKVEKKKA
jgi:DNA-directed RNA polymerase subunit RPC12/RpoP